MYYLKFKYQSRRADVHCVNDFYASMIACIIYNSLCEELVLKCYHTAL